MWRGLRGLADVPEEGFVLRGDLVPAVLLSSQPSAEELSQREHET